MSIALKGISGTALTISSVIESFKPKSLVYKKSSRLKPSGLKT